MQVNNKYVHSSRYPKLAGPSYNNKVHVIEIYSVTSTSTPAANCTDIGLGQCYYISMYQLGKSEYSIRLDPEIAQVAPTFEYPTYRVFSRPVAWPVVTMETVGQTNQ